MISCSSNLSGYPNPDIYNSGEYLNISNTEEYPNISNSGVRHVTRRGCWVHICPCLPLALCTALRKQVYRSTLSHILLYYIFLWTLCTWRRPEKTCRKQQVYSQKVEVGHGNTGHIYSAICIVLSVFYILYFVHFYLCIHLYLCIVECRVRAGEYRAH